MYYLFEMTIQNVNFYIKLMHFLVEKKVRVMTSQMVVVFTIRLNVSSQSIPNS